MIRRLGPDEVELLKELRLTALADAPTAFGSTHAREVAFADDEWRARLRPGGNPTFVWSDEHGVHGMVVAVPAADDPHVVELVGMWVAAPARGGPAADALVARVLAWAAERHAAVVRLRVIAGNERAERLYRRHGFTPTGVTVTRDRDGATEVEMERQVG